MYRTSSGKSTKNPFLALQENKQYKVIDKLYKVYSKIEQKEANWELNYLKDNKEKILFSDYFKFYFKYFCIKYNYNIEVINVYQELNNSCIYFKLVNTNLAKMLTNFIKEYSLINYRIINAQINFTNNSIALDYNFQNHTRLIENDWIYEALQNWNEMFG